MTVVLLKGISRWAKVRTPVKAFDKKTDEYVIDLVFKTDEQYDAFKATGIGTKVKVDDDGARFTTFHRKDEEVDYQSGDIKKKGPPKVFLRDDQTGEYNDWPEGLIGNGSEVTLAVETYKSKSTGNIGHRLSRVFIEKLVEFSGRNDEAAAPDTAKLPF